MGWVQEKEVVVVVEYIRYGEDAVGQLVEGWLPPEGAP